MGGDNILQVLKETKLLGPADCRDLRVRVDALDEAVWLEDQQRQIEYRNVHSQTQSLLLIFCDGWPEIEISYRRGWTYMGDAAAGLMRSIVAAHYPHGGKVLRAMVARLPPGGRIARHRDLHPSFNISHRIHVPLQTNPDVEFIVGSDRIRAEEGVAFEIDNSLPHQVANRGADHRIHFIFDYAPD
jgi:hypothetical protein